MPFPNIQSWRMIHNLLKTVSGFLVLASVLNAQTSVLDWDSVNWSGGSTTQTFSNVDGSGIDITISLTLSADSAAYSGWTYNSKKGRWEYNSYTTQTSFLSGSPIDDTTFGGDWGAEDEESLYLGVNFATDNRIQSYLDVTITFSQAVEGLNFNLFDVDSYGYNYTGGYETGIQFVDIIEQIEGNYLGNSVSSSVTYDSSRILAVTNSSGDAYQGNTSLTDSNDQNDNPASTLNLAWSSPVDTVSFRYTTGTSPVADPGQQAIGLSDFWFTRYQAVPEPSTYLFGALGGLTIIFSFIRKRRKKSMNVMPSLQR